MDPFKLPQDQNPAGTPAAEPPAIASAQPPAAEPPPAARTVTVKSSTAGDPWERSVIEKLAFSALSEQKSARRWGIFFKLATFAYVTVVLLMLIDFTSPLRRAESTEKHTAVISIEGAISGDSANSGDRIGAALNAAFKDKNTVGVVVRINSPGGSPVQSGMIYDEIKRLRKKHPDIPLHVVIEDICASGGYYIAAAADKIYVDKASIVGSIGVIMQGFGFTGTMEKLGVEGRTITSGENKAFLDPFSPQNDVHKAHAKALLSEVHDQFKKVVRDGRGKRLKETPETFSGLFWTGAKAIDMGLADEMGTVDKIAKEVFKAETIVDYTEKENVAERLAKRFGASVGAAVAERLAPKVGTIR